ncbi:MAG: cytochrome c biogenesis protein CcsA [Gammaproteobacteria bacterium]|nr:cytochrome c biogenesis protein CcsA [Gammaproteobacteria bacterium]
MTWTIALALTVILISYPVESLAAVLLPAAALTLVVAMGMPGVRIFPENSPIGLELHVAIAIVAYSLFAIAFIQAVFLALAEYKLRHHHPIMHFLPPLQTMEEILFQVTTIGFVLLTISLALGSVYTRDVMDQHLAHKIVFSVLAWCVFAVLLWGRWRYGWRGSRAVRLVIAGSVLLGLGYFGSKIVLELILNR